MEHPIQPAIPPMESYSPWLSVTSPPRSVGSPAWRCSPRSGAPAGGGSDSRGSAARSKSRELCPNLLGGRWRSEKWHLFGVYHDIIWYIIKIYIYTYVYLGLWKTKCCFFVPTIKTCTGHCWSITIKAWCGSIPVEHRKPLGVSQFLNY